jgi:hypothetical protein
MGRRRRVREGKWSIYRLGPPSHFPRIRFPHRRYRIIFYRGGRNRGGRNLKGLRPEPHRTGSPLAHKTAGPNGQTNDVRGGGSCRGPVEVNRGPLLTSGLVRLIGGCTVYRLGRYRISLASAFLTVGTASSFIEGAEIEGGRNLKGLRPEPMSDDLRTPNAAGGWARARDRAVADDC